MTLINVVIVYDLWWSSLLGPPQWPENILLVQIKTISKYGENFIQTDSHRDIAEAISTQLELAGQFNLSVDQQYPWHSMYTRPALDTTISVGTLITLHRWISPKSSITDGRKSLARGLVLKLHEEKHFAQVKIQLITALGNSYILNDVQNITDFELNGNSWPNGFTLQVGSGPNIICMSMVCVIF